MVSSDQGGGMAAGPDDRTGMAGVRRRMGPDLWIAVLLGGTSAVLYVKTLAPTVLAGDSGEFQFAAYLLGVAHATGYPLYLLLGWAWSHLLPVGDAAYRMNLFSAFWAALAVGLLYLTAVALLRQALPDLAPPGRRLVAALAAAILAVTPTFWSQAIVAEVYSLHVFFVVLLFYLLLTWAEQRNRCYLLFAACGFGLSLAHHRTTLLLVPAFLAFQVASCEFRVASFKFLLPLASCFLPLALYLYIPLRAPYTPYLHLPLTAGRELVLYDNTLAGFVNFVLGGPFGGSVDLSVDLGARLAMAGGFLRDEVGWVGIGLALLGLIGLFVKRRWALLALTGLAYVAVVGFNLVYTIGDVFVLFIPSYLMVVLWMAVGVGWFLQICKSPNLQLLLPLAWFVLPVWMAADRYADLDQSRNTTARTRWETILAEPLPSGAVLVSNDRNHIMPLWYLQYVEQRRPDLLGLFPLITPDYPTLGHTLDLALSTGRPVYLSKEMPGVEVKVKVEEEGRLWRVLGPAAEGEPAHPLDAHLAGAVALHGYDCSPCHGRPGEALHISLYWEALHPLAAEYHTFVHLLDPTGQKVAQSDRQPGGVYYPTPLWRPGEWLRDDHLLLVPAEAPAGVYHLLVGAYSFAQDGSLIPLGEPVLIGPIAVEEEGRTPRPAYFNSSNRASARSRW